MRVYVYTLGCRLNQCESEALADSFVKNGFEVEKEYNGAEITIVNTCTVTSKAEQKARRMIRLFSDKSEVVIVTGCYAEGSSCLLYTSPSPRDANASRMPSSA